MAARKNGLLAALIAASGLASGARRYAFPTYAGAVDAMRSLAARHPRIVQLSTAQELFGLGSAGTCRARAPGAQRAAPQPCLNHILHVTNRGTLPDAERPEILFLGGLHGDERIGQVSTLELARFLAEAYATHAWVRRLVDTTSTWIVPMTNAVGYEQNKRLELGLYPNRDFGYVQQPAQCMTTIAGRTVNELFAAHLFQIVVTFHGGMTSIGYPWGSFNHHRTRTSRAPDDAALADIARSMSAYASTGGVDKKYPYGTMNEQVYPVHGGMEDWGYAASFDRRNAVACAPRTHAGYSAARSAVTNASARALVFLVEAGPKSPREATLGSDADVLRPAGLGDGHVPRNIRLALTAIDFLRPHVEIVEPAAPAGRPSDAAVGRVLRIRWRAWGASRVSRAHLVWRRQSGEPWARVNGSAEAFAASARGDGVWASTPAREGSGEHELCVLPVAEGAFSLAVSARVDEHWGQPGGARVEPAELPPQAHLSRARTDDSWRMANGGARVRGRSEWTSSPIELRVSAGLKGEWARAAALSAAPFRAASSCGGSAARRRAFGLAADRRPGLFAPSREARRDVSGHTALTRGDSE